MPPPFGILYIIRSISSLPSCSHIPFVISVLVMSYQIWYRQYHPLFAILSVVYHPLYQTIPIRYHNPSLISQPISYITCILSYPIPFIIWNPIRFMSPSRYIWPHLLLPCFLPSFTALPSLLSNCSTPPRSQSTFSIAPLPVANSTRCCLSNTGVLHGKSFGSCLQYPHYCSHSR